MDTANEMIQLSKLLENEWRGGAIDRRRARELALSLLPSTPELRHSLSSIADRMARN